MRISPKVFFKYTIVAKVQGLYSQSIFVGLKNWKKKKKKLNIE